MERATRVSDALIWIHLFWFVIPFRLPVHTFLSLSNENLFSLEHLLSYPQLPVYLCAHTHSLRILSVITSTPQAGPNLQKTFSGAHLYSLLSSSQYTHWWTSLPMLQVLLLILYETWVFQQVLWIHLWASHSAFSIALLAASCISKCTNL